MSNHYLSFATILLPRPGTDLSRYSVIACDQFTSQPDYWQKVRDNVGNAPSTLGMILPVGGFLTLACLIAAMQYILNKPKKDKKTEEVAK